MGQPARYLVPPHVRETIGPGINYLVQASHSRILLSKKHEDCLCLLKPIRQALVLELGAIKYPGERIYGFATVPIQLPVRRSVAPIAPADPNREFYAIGRYPGVSSVTRIVIAGGAFHLSTMPALTAPPRFETSGAFIDDRQIIGFGGTIEPTGVHYDDVYIYDLLTGRTIRILPAHGETWHEADEQVIVAVHQGDVHFLCGVASTRHYVLSMEYIMRRIRRANAQWEQEEREHLPGPERQGPERRGPEAPGPELRRRQGAPAPPHPQQGRHPRHQRLGSKAEPLFLKSTLLRLPGRLLATAPALRERKVVVEQAGRPHQPRTGSGPSAGGFRQSTGNEAQIPLPSPAELRRRAARRHTQPPAERQPESEPECDSSNANDNGGSEQARLPTPIGWEQ